jgi:soluble lytic murein transglycosylase
MCWAVLAFVLQTAAFARPGDLSGIFELSRERRYDEAVVALTEMRDRDPHDFDHRGLHYLLGLLAYRSGQTGIASAAFHRIVERDPELTPYALAHLSRISGAGNLPLQKLYLDELLLNYPDHPLAGAARLQKAALSHETGDPGEAIRLLRSGGKTITSLNSQSRRYERENAILLASSLQAAGQTAAAEDLARTILAVTDPQSADDAALRAVEILDSRRVDGLTADEHMFRGNVYQANRAFADARRHLSSVIEKYPDAAAAAEAVFLTGRGYSQTDDHAEAVKWFERVMERYPQSQSSADALLQAASAYSRIGRAREAMARYQTFIERHHAHPTAERAYLNIVDVLRDQHDDSAALRWCAKTREAFAGKRAETLAWFSEARIYLSRGEWEKALAPLRTVQAARDLGGRTPGATSHAEVTFLLGFALEQMGRFDESIATYLSLGDGRSEYYGRRATERLKGMHDIEPAAPALSQRTAVLASELNSRDVKQRRSSALGLFRIARSVDLRQRALAVLRETAMPIDIPIRDVASSDTRSESHDAGTVQHKLLSLHLYDEAFIESRGGLDLRRIDIANAVTLPARAISSAAEASVRALSPDLPLELIPADVLSSAYPPAYRDELLATSASVDPRLLLSIMRQESRFEATAKSGAAARGLMQFIPDTAERVAVRLDLKGIDRADLYSPAVSLMLSGEYLTQLFARFPGQPEAVTASYNGGDDNMARWLGRSRSNQPDRYVAEINFSQTKDYVEKVMANYRVYQFLYNEQLLRR